MAGHLRVPPPPPPGEPGAGEHPELPSWDNRDPGGPQDILSRDLSETPGPGEVPRTHSQEEQDVPRLPTVAVWGRPCLAAMAHAWWA
eukprot:206826-Prorocentrum_lima.AAC.1